MLFALVLYTQKNKILQGHIYNWELIDWKKIREYVKKLIKNNHVNALCT